jgi:hypothetical protein
VQKSNPASESITGQPLHQQTTLPWVGYCWKRFITMRLQP